MCCVFDFATIPSIYTTPLSWLNIFNENVFSKALCTACQIEIINLLYLSQGKTINFCELFIIYFVTKRQSSSLDDVRGMLYVLFEVDVKSMYELMFANWNWLIPSFVTITILCDCQSIFHLRDRDTKLTTNHCNSFDSLVILLSKQRWWTLFDMKERYSHEFSLITFSWDVRDENLRDYFNPGNFEEHFFQRLILTPSVLQRTAFTF